MSNTFYITTPLYYVNDEPHIGHAYTTILADVLTRYHRLLYPDDAAHFLTGLDEHGQKVAQAAAKAGVDPQAHCNRMAKLWRGVWDKLGIEPDDFIRTTEPRHIEVVNRILNAINDNGDIYRKDYEGWYSVFEERFFTEKDLVDGKDPIGGRPVELIRESNYFFRMSKYQDWLIRHYEEHPDAVIPESRLNEVKGFLRQPLDDLCISRPKSRLAWGIPVPWDEDYVTYVWFDALLNYYSATVTPPVGKAVQWPADYHLIGKDILTTHAVYWPIMLHAAGLEPPRHILAHGWWLTKGAAKMSKSTGEKTKPLDLADKYGVDALRYFLMRDMTVGQDATFSEEQFIQRYNSDLANDLGNLYSRLATLWQKFDWGKMPKNYAYKDLLDIEFKGEFGYTHGKVPQLANHVRKELENLRPNAALELLMSVVKKLNRAVEHCEPWRPEQGISPSVGWSMNYTIHVLFEIARLLEPVMPEKMSLLKSWIMPYEDFFDPQPGGHLFPRIQNQRDELANRPTEKPQHRSTAAPQHQVSPAPQHQISIDDFARLDIRAATIIAARPHPNADKLLVLEVDIGGEIRQVVAGIAGNYQAENLIGRQVAVIVNLKPAILRGEKSEGMLLAATGDRVTLLDFDEAVPPGARIK